MSYIVNTEPEAVRGLPVAGERSQRSSGSNVPLPGLSLSVFFHPTPPTSVSNQFCVSPHSYVFHLWLSQKGG